MPVKTIIKLRRDTSATWASTNPVLASGELGIDTTLNKIKIGDGTTAWASLPFASGGGVVTSLTAPTDTSSVWFKTDTAQIFQYYDGFWVEQVAPSAGLTLSQVAAQHIPDVAGKNKIINGGFDFWQRGTSFSFTPGAYAGTYTADRWAFTNGGSPTGLAVTRQTANSTNQQYGLRWGRATGATGTGAVVAAQVLETATAKSLAGQTVTLSFYALAGATAPTLQLSITFGTGVDQGFNSLQVGGWTSATTYTNAATVSTSTLTRYTYTFVVPSGTNEILVGFYYVPTGTAASSEWFQFEALQLEVGSVATPFSRAGGTLQGELAACQRYYVRQTSALSGYARLSTAAGASSTTLVYVPVPVPVQLRTKPTSIDYSSLSLADGAGSFVSITSAAIDQASETIVNVSCNVASGLTQYRPYAIQINNSTSAYLGFSAEL